MRFSNKQIINDLDNLLQKEYPDNIKEVILFGSQTTENATKDSDNDILVILKNLPIGKCNGIFLICVMKLN
jgi:predicted nucleotidyltransferase